MVIFPSILKSIIMLSIFENCKLSCYLEKKIESKKEERKPSCLAPCNGFGIFTVLLESEL